MRYIQKDKPTLICCKTKIGFGSPNKEGKESSHGAPLGDEETDLTKKNIGWDYGPFEIPNDIYDFWDNTNAGSKLENKWNKEFNNHKSKYPEEAKEL
jgi:transketolase